MWNKMDILTRYLNLYNACFIFISFIVLIVTIAIYIKREIQFRRHKKLKLQLLKIYKKALKTGDESYFKQEITKKLSLNCVAIIAAYFFKKHREKHILTYFDLEPFQNKLRLLLKKGTIKQKIDAANMLAYYPCEKTNQALIQACNSSRQEVAIAAALSLVKNASGISIIQIIITLFNKIPQKGVFCFFRLLPSNKFLELESLINCEDFSNHQFFTILKKISKNYITPYLILAKEDERTYMQTFFENLLELQTTPQGIIHSCYLLNFINEECYIKKSLSIEKLITEHFDLKSKLFIDKN